MAAERGHLEVVKLLISSGAKLDSRDKVRKYKLQCTSIITLYVYNMYKVSLLLLLLLLLLLYYYKPASYMLYM